MRMSASWFGSWTHRIQGRGAIDPRPESGLPSDRHPDRIKRAVVLEAVKVWPGKGGVRRKVGASANLDSSCARRLCNTAGRGEETELQVEQRNRSRTMCPALKPLDKKGPIQGGDGVNRFAPRAECVEEEHPRDDHGRWTEKHGGDGGSGKKDSGIKALGDARNRPVPPIPDRETVLADLLKRVPALTRERAIEELEAMGL